MVAGGHANDAALAGECENSSYRRESQDEQQSDHQKIRRIHNGLPGPRAYPAAL